MARGGTRTGAGRPKGSVDPKTKLAKEAIEQVFTSLQSDDETSLETWARNNLGVFYTALFPKLLPVQMQHSGESGGPLYVVIGDPRSAPADSASS